MSDAQPDFKQTLKPGDSKARLKWACRRGMLELDVLLEPFIDLPDGYDALSDADKARFVRLLECQDPELFAWFMGHESCPDPELARMVALISQHNLSRRQ